MRAFGTLGIVGLVGVILGAVNWGLVGLFDYDLVEAIVGAGTAADAIYIAIGVTGILALGAVVWAFGVITRGGAGSILAVLGAVAAVIAVIGAVNWGLVGLFGYDVVEAIFGTGTAANAVYVIIGAAGLLTIPTLLGAWGFRSGERRLETTSDTVQLRRALDESRRRDEELLRALDEGRRRDEELSRRLDEFQRPAAAKGVRDEEDAYATEREVYETDRASEPYETDRVSEVYETERADRVSEVSEPYRGPDGEMVERDEAEYGEMAERDEAEYGDMVERDEAEYADPVGSAATSGSQGAERYSADAEERYEESFVDDGAYEPRPGVTAEDEEAGRRREAA